VDDENGGSTDLISIGTDESETKTGIVIRAGFREMKFGLKR